MTYIMIIYLCISSSTSCQFLNQEFSSQNTCEAASIVLMEQYKREASNLWNKVMINCFLK